MVKNCIIVSTNWAVLDRHIFNNNRWANHMWTPCIWARGYPHLPLRQRVRKFAWTVECFSFFLPGENLQPSTDIQMMWLVWDSPAWTGEGTPTDIRPLPGGLLGMLDAQASVEDFTWWWGTGPGSSAGVLGRQPMAQKCSNSQIKNRTRDEARHYCKWGRRNPSP